MDPRDPWWMHDPAIQALVQHTMEDLQRGFDERDPVDDSDASDPVVDELFSGASLRALALARDDLSRARADYDNAVETGRSAGLSWAEIGQVLGVSKQQLHRRFRAGPNRRRHK